jgi:Skp family chaperone for outer membrane proteins
MMEMEGSLKQMMARLLEEMWADISAKIQASQEEVKAGQAEMKIGREEIKTPQDKLKQDINDHIEATINSVPSDLEQTIKKRMEDVLSCFHHKTQSPHTEMIGDAQIELQTVESSLDGRGINNSQARLQVNAH